jgi:hypothetical protein
MHGAHVPAVERKRSERMTFAQLLQSDPRPVGEVLLDALHNADVAMQDMRAQLTTGEPVTVDQLDRFISISRLTHHLAKTTVDAKVEVQLVEQARASVGELGMILSEVLLAVLDSLPLTPTWREHLLEVADHQLRTIAHRQGTHVLDLPEAPTDAPVPPAEPVLLPSLPAPLVRSPASGHLLVNRSDSPAGMAANVRAWNGQPGID